MTKPAKTAILVSMAMAVAMITVAVIEDRDGLREAAAAKTPQDIEKFARHRGTVVHSVREHLVYTYIVRVGYPVPGFIAREYRWGEEVPGGFQSKVTIFNQ